jgi:sugar fermentation stimulation protein A
MNLPAPLFKGRLVRRYQRFLAEVELADGTRVTAHTPNTGSMLQCAVPGHQVLVSKHDNPQRKLNYTLELIRVKDRWVDTHTLRANRVVEEGLRQGWIAELAGGTVSPEFRYGDSRLDFYLERDAEQVLVEVKNVTLTDGGTLALFPDAVTTRGQKHLRALRAALAEHRAGTAHRLARLAHAIVIAAVDADAQVVGEHALVGLAVAVVITAVA